MNSSRFFSLIVGCMFLAVCAYMGAELYGRISLSTAQSAYITQVEEVLELQGIVLRQEQSITLQRGESFAAQSGQRLAAGELLTLDSKGQGLPAPLSGIFYDSTDGFEYLSVDAIDPEDIGALEALLEAKAESSAHGRLVTGNAWYYWALCSHRAEVEASCRIQFEGFDQAIRARLISSYVTEDGRQLLLLRLNQGGEEYLSLRKIGAVVRQ